MTTASESLRRILLEKPCLQIASDGRDRIYLLVSAGKEESLLQCRDIAGRLRWQQTIPTNFRIDLRLSSRGNIWVSLPDRLNAYDGSGKAIGSVPLPLAEGERLGGFVLLDDSLLVSFVPTAGPQPPTYARLARLNKADGNTLWSTTLPIQPIAHSALQRRRAATGFQAEPIPAWQPVDWRPDHEDPLIVNGTRLLASFMEMSSGLGISYCLDISSGELLWTTLPVPTGSKAAVSAGSFLIGEQGYGVFATSLFAPNGQQQQRWATHGHYVISSSSEVCLVEMENTLPSRSHLATLLPDGSVRRGAHLSGYRTSYPALSSDSRIAFWRHDGKQHTGLFIGDSEGNLSERVTVPNTDSRLFFSRTLLTVDGTVFVAANLWQASCELWAFPTDLVPLAESPWPCGNGNLANNPVVPYTAGASTP